MRIKDKIQQKIIDRYNSEKSNNKKIDITSSAKDLKDPFFVEFEHEILKKTEKKEKISDLTEKAEELKEIDDQDQDLVNHELLSKIKKKTSKIINKINMNFYKKHKLELKNVIINDMLKTFLDNKTSSYMKTVICSAVEKIVEKEFDVSALKKQQRKKELFKNAIEQIEVDLNTMFEEYTAEKVKKMTVFQKQNFIKYFMQSLEKKHLNQFRMNNKLMEAEYNVLKAKIQQYILYRENKRFLV